MSNIKTLRKIIPGIIIILFLSTIVSYAVFSDNSQNTVNSSEILMNKLKINESSLGVRTYGSNAHFDNIVINDIILNDDDVNPFRYCGEYFDKETGTLYLRARYYDPEIGRFISEDIEWGKDTDSLSLNLYTYCGNNPILLNDPSGCYYIVIQDNKYKLVSSDWAATYLKPAASFVPLLGGLLGNGIDSTYGKVVGGNSMSPVGMKGVAAFFMDVLSGNMGGVCYI